MTLEERYAAQWRKDARAEGHRRGFPSSYVNLSPLGKPNAHIEILAAIKSGATTRLKIMKETGFSQKLVENRLTTLQNEGKIIYINNQWSLVECLT